MARMHVITNAATGQTVEIPFTPEEEAAADTTAIPSRAEIDAERERRIARPLTVTASVGSFPVNMDPLSQRNLQGLASVGQYLVSSGSTQTTSFRDYNNVTHDLLPADLVAMGLQVAGRIQACYAAEWALKAVDPIPADYADDGYWP